MNQRKAQCFFCKPYNDQIHSKLENEILQNEFSQDTLWGFRVQTRRKGCLQAIYIEKQTFIEELIDPFGNTTVSERISYSQIKFQISSSPPHLLIFQPPRNYRKLINQLAQYTDYSIAIENKTVRLFDWVDILVKRHLENIVTRANIYPINYDKVTTGKLTLSSNIDLKGKITQTLSNTSYNIKSLKLKFKDKIPDVELYNDGKLIFSRPVESNIFEIFYEAFYELTLKKNS